MYYQPPPHLLHCGGLSPTVEQTKPCSTVEQTKPRSTVEQTKPHSTVEQT